MRRVGRVFWITQILWVVMLFLTPQIQLLFLIALIGTVSWWFFGIIPSRLIASMIFDKVRCPGCQMEIPAVMRWQIGPYTDHKERHFVFAKDPSSGARAGHINCPQCESTILL